MNVPALITAAPTAFFEDGALDIASTSRILEHALAGGVDGIFVNGTTGEFTALDREERSAVVRAAVQVAGPERVIAHVGAASPYEVQLLTEDAREAGVSRFSVLTPFYLPATRDGVARQVEAVGKQPDDEVYLYLFPDRTGVHLSPAEAAALIDEFDLTGAKISIAGTGFIGDLARAASPQRRLFSGNDGLIREVAAVGGKGVVSGVSSAVPAPFVAQARAVGAGDADAADRLAPAIAELVGLLGPSIAALKLALLAQGVIATPRCRMAIDAPAAATAGEIRRSVADSSPEALAAQA